MGEVLTLESIETRIMRLPNRPPAMLAQDMAEIYEVEPRQIGQAVKRNPDRFPLDFCFRLTAAEDKYLKSTKLISSQIRRAVPLAFTHEGANMLSASLRSPVAAARAVQIMRAFSRLEAKGVSGELVSLDKRVAAVEVAVAGEKETLHHPSPAFRRNCRLQGSGRGFSFWYDPEVKTFLEKCYGTATLSRIAEMGRARFGLARAPSRSSIHRYYQWLENKAA